MTSRVTARAWGSATLLLLLCLGAAAVALAVDARLAARLDRDTAAAVDELVRQAGARGLPTEPLVAKALEGAMKKAPGSRIVAAVRGYADAMANAVALLPPRSNTTEIAAAAGALLAGVPGDTLKQVLRARQGQSITVPLVVLADLVSRQVPAGPAAASLLAATRDGVTDAELLQLRDRVNGEILSGATPLEALRLGIAASGRRERAPREGSAAPPRPTPRTAEPGGEGSQFRRWTPSLSLESGFRDDASGRPTARLLTTARLDHDRTTHGYWGALELSQRLASGDATPSPGVELGFWRRRQRWVLSASVGQAPLTIGGSGNVIDPSVHPGDSTEVAGPPLDGLNPRGGRSAGRRVLATALQLGLSWEVGRTTLAGNGGWRMASSVGPGVFGDLRTNYQLTQRMGVQLGWRGGTHWPVSAHERFGNGLTLGVRFSTRSAGSFDATDDPATTPDAAALLPGVPAPDAASEARFVLTQLGDEQFRLEFSGLAARRVELAGDLTDWEPRALTPWGLRGWRTTVAAPSGVYAVNIRLDDGDWLPPPGLPARDDGFSGRVGLLILP